LKNLELNLKMRWVVINFSKYTKQYR
jgi:hypothetical protein